MILEVHFSSQLETKKKRFFVEKEVGVLFQKVWPSAAISTESSMLAEQFVFNEN